jgi:hypothetical protein
MVPNHQPDEVLIHPNPHISITTCLIFQASKYFCSRGSIMDQQGSSWISPALMVASTHDKIAIKTLIRKDHQGFNG